MAKQTLSNGESGLNFRNALNSMFTELYGGSPAYTSPLSPTVGGTGVANNAANTLTFSGNYGLSLTLSGATSLTLPTSGTLLASGGALGTPSGGTLTNCSGLPASGIASLGTGVATALGVAVNGSGAISLTTGAMFVTPVLGAATGSSLALGGATIGSNALAVTGTVLFNTPLAAGSGGTGLSSLGTGVATALGQNASSATGFLANGTSANLGAGYTTAIYSIGSSSNGGTITPAISNGNHQSLTNAATAAWTLAAPTGITSGTASEMKITVVNAHTGTLVAPTLSGFAASSNTSAYTLTNDATFDFFFTMDYLSGGSNYVRLTVVAR